MPRRPMIISSLALALASLAACKFPYPPDVNDDGRTSSDAGLDARPNDAPDAVPVIAFTSDRTGNFDIFTMRLDGSLPTNLTGDPSEDSGAMWSPTGDRIAFLSTRTGTRELYVMRADGTMPMNISRGSASDAAWAPDGSRLAFSSDRSGSTQIYVALADGSSPLPLTTAGGSGPAYSPDGARIAYASTSGIFLMSATGANPVRLTTGSDGAPAWNFDGTAIALSHRVTFGDSDVHVVRPDGTPVVEMRDVGTLAIGPVWSPDGTQIAWSGGVDTNYEIYVARANGTALRNASMTPGLDRAPRWSPDGSTIAFDSGGDIVLVPASGGPTDNITNHPSFDQQPVWRPAP